MQTQTRLTREGAGHGGRHPFGVGDGDFERAAGRRAPRSPSAFTTGRAALVLAADDSNRPGTRRRPWDTSSRPLFPPPGSFKVPQSQADDLRNSTGEFRSAVRRRDEPAGIK